MFISGDGFEITTCVPMTEKKKLFKNHKRLPQKERIKIVGDYPRNLLSQLIFNQLGAMHLLAPYLPANINSDFSLSDFSRALIREMYIHTGVKPPKFLSPNFNASFTGHRISDKKAVVAYSAGKDSMWNMWWTSKKFGAENVMAVHVRGLNKSNGAREAEYAKVQAKRLGFKHFREIKLLNSSLNTGYQVMRSRDMFLVGLVLPYALEFGASKIITEGFAETNNEVEPFTGKAKSMKYFNFLLNDMLGISVSVVWRNRKEMDVVKELLENKPDWMPYICNCFTPPCYQPPRRNYWREKASTFKLYSSQCGSCIKCRIVNLARVLYDPTMVQTKRKDIEFFLRNTAFWLVDRGFPNHRDMVEGSFLRDFKEAAKIYDVEISNHE